MGDTLTVPSRTSASPLRSINGPTSRACPLRLAFAGLGWIGRHRMRAVVETATVQVVALADPDEAALSDALAIAPGARPTQDFASLLDEDLDGIVIATPNAMHAEQAIAALERGIAVFCQKPLGRNAAETRAVVAAARRADRLLAVDFCYRTVQGVREMRRLMRSGDLGEVYTADLTFHNAYGPDKPWFYDPRLSGGGCVIDLGIHLVDLLLWTWDFPTFCRVEARLFQEGKPIHPGADVLEDYASILMETDAGRIARLTCSWNLPAGRDAIIKAEYYSPRSGVSLRNIDGSFHDFRVERLDGTSRRQLAASAGGWGGRPIVAWTERLATSRSYDPQAEQFVDVAAMLDRIYQRCES